MTVRVREISPSHVLGRSVWIGNCSDEVFEGDVDGAELLRLAELWSDLPLDPHLNDSGRYRERRYAKMLYCPSNGELQRMQETVFFQPRRYNPVNSGPRKFQPISEYFLESAFIRRVLGHFARRFATVLQAPQLELNLHQVRIIGRANEPGLVTPEGIHKDGVDFSCQILFGRRNADGGESIIYDNDKAPLVGATMTDILDFYCFRDPEIHHSVTPISPTDPGRHATRDVLGMDFSINRQKVEDGSDIPEIPQEPLSHQRAL